MVFRIVGKALKVISGRFRSSLRADADREKGRSILDDLTPEWQNKFM